MISKLVLRIISTLGDISNFSNLSKHFRNKSSSNMSTILMGFKEDKELLNMIGAHVNTLK